MTNQTILKKIDWFILLYGILLSCGAYLIWGKEFFLAVFIGVAVAYVNWVISRILAMHLLQLGRIELVFSVLAIKLALVVTLIFLILLFTSVKPVPFMIGLSTLVVGVLTKSLSVGFVESDTDEGDND